MFNGIGVGLHNLSKLSNAKSRSISAENFTGEKGKGGMATGGANEKCARDLGQGWKVSPCININSGETAVIANIKSSGAIQHIWMTCSNSKWRSTILKIFWDDEKTPSVNVPVGDFFLNGWCERSNVAALPIVVNPAGGFNSYFEMPFRKAARIEITNLSHENLNIYYQIDYVETDIPDDLAYFHASWRRTNPLTHKSVFTLIDGIKGKGQYVGTYLAWQVNNNGWWGEGEIKFYLDGDKEFPTICGTGTEDYFGGAWNFEHPQGEYGLFSTPYLGMPQVLKPDGLYKANTRFSLYRFHIQDPIRFEQDLKVTIQDLGWHRDGSGRYLPQHSDISALTYWYQAEPHNKLYEPADKDEYSPN